jgi:hypothetical protein
MLGTNRHTRKRHFRNTSITQAHLEGNTKNVAQKSGNQANSEAAEDLMVTHGGA